MKVSVALRRWLVVPVALVLLGTACGESEPEGTGTGSEPGQEASFDAEAVGIGELLGQVHGHHLAALELYGDGDQTGALVHAAHPVHEILASVVPEIEEADADAAAELADSVEATRQLVEDGADISEIEASIEAAGSATDAARAAVAGDADDDPGYQASVISALLATSGHEYEEAIAGSGGDEVRNLPEYQDGYAFVTQSAKMYEAIAGDVEAASSEEAEEIDHAFEVLAEAFPSITPPDELTSLVDVQSATALIGHELEETLGALALTESDPVEIVAEINSLLDELVEAYEAGDAERAAELSAEAYLENYEVIEAAVIENAPDVNAELEPLLGAELRRQIQDGAPVEDINDMVEQVRSLLDDALAALEAAE